MNVQCFLREEKGSSLTDRSPDEYFRRVARRPEKDGKKQEIELKAAAINRRKAVFLNAGVFSAKQKAAVR